MQPCADGNSFVRAPVGRWIAAGCTIVWCHSPTLCGAVCWGRQTAEQTRSVMRLFDGFPQLASQFDILLDGSAIEKVETASLMVLVDWVREHLSELRRCLRKEVGVVPPGPGGFLLAGISPVLSGSWPVSLVRDAREAYRAVLPGDGDALCDEVCALVEEVRGVPPLVSELRQLLRVKRGRLSVRQAAAAMHLSPRTLQRALGEFGRSYRQEQQEARYIAAEELLAGDDKITSVAAQLGLSEASFTTLIRMRAGVTPGELRRRLRPKPE